MNKDYNEMFLAVEEKKLKLMEEWVRLKKEEVTVSIHRLRLYRKRHFPEELHHEPPVAETIPACPMS